MTTEVRNVKVTDEFQDMTERLVVELASRAPINRKHYDIVSDGLVEMFGKEFGELETREYLRYKMRVAIREGVDFGFEIPQPSNIMSIRRNKHEDTSRD